MESVDGGNDEEILYVRGSSPDISNFDSFPREFGKEIWFILLFVNNPNLYSCLKFIIIIFVY